MQKLENRCDLLLIQHQKWMASVTRFIVAHGMGSPHLHGYHRLTLAHFFLPEKGTIISVAPQGLYRNTGDFCQPSSVAGRQYSDTERDAINH